MLQLYSREVEKSHVLRGRIAVKKIYLQVFLWMILGCWTTVQAQSFKRFEINPFGGFVVSGDISLENEESETVDLHIGSSYCLGGNLGVNISESDSIEASWQRQFSDGWVPTGIYDPDC